MNWMKWNELTLIIDIDECLQNACGSGAVCTNVPGLFRCDCPEKYIARGTPEFGCDRAAVDVSCNFDVDCTDNAQCAEGVCRCKSGFQPSGIDCVGMLINFNQL